MTSYGFRPAGCPTDNVLLWNLQGDVRFDRPLPYICLPPGDWSVDGWRDRKGGRICPYASDCWLDEPFAGLEVRLCMPHQQARQRTLPVLLLFPSLTM